jgi:uncharacterized protein (TIGR03435 family)
MLKQGWRRAGIGIACAAALATVAPSAVYGQEKPALDAGNASGAAQPVKRDYRFEVASIRATDPPGLYKGGSPQPYSPGLYREERIYLAALVMKAFNLKQPYQIGYPQWMLSSYFSINATIPDGATKADLPIMIRHLLEDRFALKYHHETRQVTGYELVVAKSGAKLEKSATPEFDGSKLGGSGFEVKNGMPHFGKDAGSMDVCFSGNGSLGCAMHGRNRTMGTLAADLANKMDAPVTDATELEGGYDYTVVFSQEPSSSSGIAVSPGGGTPVTTLPDTPPERPFLRDALREQLGLELRLVKNLPVDVVVVDSANKVPTEN